MAATRAVAEDIRNFSNATRDDGSIIQSKSAVGLKNFTLFKKLPLEFQRMVWRHAANVPHVVALMSLGRNPFHHLTPLSTGRTRILEVCQEARAEAS